jgi:hypothetical protein
MFPVELLKLASLKLNYLPALVPANTQPSSLLQE